MVTIGLERGSENVLHGERNGQAMLLKIILWASLSNLLFSPIPAAQRKSDREAVGLNGQVKTISVKEGGMRVVAGKNQEKCCQFLYSYTFDVTGNRIDAKASIPFIDEGPINPLKKEAKYDVNEKIIEELTYKSDGSLVWRTVYVYDANGNKIEESIYSANNSLYQKGIYTFDPKKHLVEYVVHYGDGTPFTRETYAKHDAKRNWQKQIIWHWNSENKKWEPYTVRYRTITYY
jgi:hypothetical protein